MAHVVPTETTITITDEDGNAVATTNYPQLVTLRLGLKFEIEHPGMKMTRRPLVPIAQRITGCKRSKKAAWEAVNDIIVRGYGDQFAMVRPW
jgi:hypothetical protein